MFRIVVPMYNVAGLIGRNIAQLRGQTHCDFTCLLVDDGSSDGTVETARAAVDGDPRFDIVVNTDRRYALRNTADGIARLAPADDDVIVPIDADDCLAGPGVLARVADAYAESACWLTYGSYRKEGGGPGRECRPYAARVIRDGSYRTSPWHATHLKTFKGWLWRAIPGGAFTTTQVEIGWTARRALFRGRLRAWSQWRRLTPKDLTDPSGACFRRCCDRAFMYPLLELAGPHARFIADVLYIYRDTNPCLPYEVSRRQARWRTRCIRAILRDRPPCRRLTAQPPVA